MNCPNCNSTDTTQYTHDGFQYAFTVRWNCDHEFDETDE